MKTSIIAAFAITVMGAAAPAFAQDAPAPTLTQPQGYATLGYTYLNPYNHALGELTGRAGLRFGKYWGVEGEAGGGIVGNHFTSPAGNRASLNSGISTAVYAVGYLPITSKLELLARGGYGESSVQIRSDVGPSTANANSSKTLVSANYGAGAQYMLTPKDGFRIDYTRRDYQAPGFDNPKDTDTYALSYVRKF